MVMRLDEKSEVTLNRVVETTGIPSTKRGR